MKRGCIKLTHPHFIISTYSLFHFPDIVGLQELCEVVVLLHARDLSELGVDGIVVGGSIDVADDTKGDGEAVTVAHQGEFQL